MKFDSPTIWQTFLAIDSKPKHFPRGKKITLMPTASRMLKIKFDWFDMTLKAEEPSLITTTSAVALDVQCKLSVTNICFGFDDGKFSHCTQIGILAVQRLNVTQRQWQQQQQQQRRPRREETKIE